jgi:hypothetical protein
VTCLRSARRKSVPARRRGPRADRADWTGLQPGRRDGDVGADRLDGLWSDEDFAGWYPRDGWPGNLARAASDGEGAAVPARPLRP